MGGVGSGRRNLRRLRPVKNTCALCHQSFVGYYRDDTIYRSMRSRVKLAVRRRDGWFIHVPGECINKDKIRR